MLMEDARNNSDPLGKIIDRSVSEMDESLKRVGHLLDSLEYEAIYKENRRIEEERKNIIDNRTDLQRMYDQKYKLSKNDPLNKVLEFYESTL